MMRFLIHCLSLILLDVGRAEVDTVKLPESASKSTSNVLFLILTQPTLYGTQEAKKITTKIERAGYDYRLESGYDTIYAQGWYTYVPWLNEALGEKTKTTFSPYDYFFFVDPLSIDAIRFDMIQSVLDGIKMKKKRQMLLLADELLDDGDQSLIIHHFSDASLKYPSSSNFMFNRDLAKALVRGDYHSNGFIIDPLFEVMQKVKKVEDNVRLMKGYQYPITIKTFCDYLGSCDSGRDKFVSKSKPISPHVQITESNTNSLRRSMYGLREEQSEANAVSTDASIGMSSSTKSGQVAQAKALMKWTNTMPSFYDMTSKKITIVVKTTEGNHAKRIPGFMKAFDADLLGNQKLSLKELEILFMTDVDINLKDSPVSLSENASDEPGYLQTVRNTIAKARKKKSMNLSARFINVNVNDERGHCGKMIAILKYLRLKYDLEATEASKNGIGNSEKDDAIANTKETDIPAFHVISDDDTFWNVHGLVDYLRQLDYNQPIYGGERYGYSTDPLFRQGYNYITTGGGMILTHPVLKDFFSYQNLERNLIDITPFDVVDGAKPKLFDISVDNVVCQRSDQPDDMALGQHFKRLGIPALHHPGFHQRRPKDYPIEYLKRVEAISYHNVHSQDAKTPVQDVMLRFLIRGGEERFQKGAFKAKEEL